MHLLIYAANTRVGGAIGAAASLIDQIPHIEASGLMSRVERITIEVSTSVMATMTKTEEVTATPRVRLSVRDDLPRFLRPRIQPSADASFSIFGPTHIHRRAPVEVTGFADSSIFTQPGIRRDPRSVVTGFRKRRLLRGSDAVIVEAESLRRRVIELLPPERVHVVPNTIPVVFENPSKWTFTVLPPRLPGEVRLFYPARGYPHKNHSIIQPTAREFRRMTGRSLRVVTTLTDTEINRMSLSGEDSLINLGPVPVSSCPHLYLATDGLFFPSLLETFSSAPLEAQFLKRPAVCSDVPCIAHTVGTNVQYFDALDARSAASAVVSAILDTDRCAQLIESGWLDSRQRPDSLSRATQIMRIVLDLAERPH